LIECQKKTTTVSQGTVLGPVLFLLFINNLPDQISPGETARLFADDCLVHHEIWSEEDQQIFQREILKHSTTGKHSGA